MQISPMSCKRDNRVYKPDLDVHIIVVICTQMGQRSENVVKSSVKLQNQRPLSDFPVQTTERHT